ncbi:MAG: tRNA uridine-5-carboxymethylaminomethyl(34) synthesis GTPase MnmE [Ruminiclostridium sp.]|nr:tRNA uridine-5-carboxymethylaminomethyl(34) synthesis GTPase MnmE [Ruminiclostridium sp.]
METIAATATPPGTGGIAVIRISGDNAVTIAERVFVPAGGKPVGSMRGYTACYGEIRDGDTRLDDGVLLIFRAPHSYTGEDTAEISCHGGVYAAKRVLSACFAAGAVPAQAGEFTKRALLNGKLSLTQAEAVADVIAAQNEQFLACSRAQREGALYRSISGIAEELLSLITLIQAWIDYPDEMEDEFDGALEADKLKDIVRRLDALLGSYTEGQILRDGLPCAIVGKPNAGKSTLMNLLTGTERSIVTDIEGTTRDIVEETVMLGGLMLRLADCAGIRDTDDPVEGIGVERMLKKLDEAALIFAVFDSSRALSDEDERLIDKISGRNVLCIINKTDLPEAPGIGRLETLFPHTLRISAKDPAAVGTIAGAVSEMTGLGKLDLSSGFIANERQRRCAAEARDFASQAYTALETGMTLDAVGVMCENALDRLYELSGEKTSDNVIEQVFSRFCVGK